MKLTEKIKNMYSEMNWKLTGTLMSIPILSELVVDNFSKYALGATKSPFDDSGSYIQTGFGMALMLGIGAHISHKNIEKVKTKKILKKSEKKFRTFVEDAEDLMYITDKDGYFTDVSNSIVNSLGYSREELMKMKITQILTKKEKDYYKLNKDEFISNGKLNTETIFVTKDKKEICGELKATAAYDGKGNYIGCKTVFHNLTERKRAETNLKERIKELNGLHDLGRLVEEVESLDELLPKFAKKIIPKNMAFPDKVYVRLKINGKNYVNSHGFRIKDFSHSISKPIKVKKIKRGNLTMGYIEDLEINKFEQKLISTYARRLGKIIGKKYDEEKIKEQSVRDPLTGLYNRHYYEQNINKIINSAKEEKQKVGFSMYDLNNFKYLNDNFGHLKGDKILKDFAHLLSSSIKSSDISIRFGGDEFLVISPNATHLTKQKIDDRLEKKINSYNKHNNKDIDYNVSVSAGHTLRSDLSNKSIEYTLDIADKNMYQHKKGLGGKII